jgi:PIN domain nuclease of toxin-antitoxin system
VKILPDNHVFLWIVVADPRLTPRYRSYFENPDSELFFSVASCWEIIIKTGINRLHFPLPVTDYLMK